MLIKLEDGWAPEHKTSHLLAHGVVTLLIELSQVDAAAVDWIHVLIVDGLV